MRVRKRLGEMLIDSGLMTKESLGQALARQKDSGLRLGDFLIDKEIIPEEQIIDLLSTQLQIRKFDPNDYEITPALAQVIDIDLAAKYRLVPLRKGDFFLTVAMVDPMISRPWTPWKSSATSRSNRSSAPSPSSVS